MSTNCLELSVTDILFLIGVRARTGELVMESGNNIGTILFHQGKILQALSPYSRTIGDLLVDDGVITEGDLFDTLKLQKMNSDVPLGALLLKTGKVSFEIVEMMVHEQIRKAVKEFQSWENLNFSFTHKDIKPFDRIYLPLQEFIQPETINAAKAFLAGEPPASTMSSSEASTTTSH
ncbi:MAG TPA: DUF4388 domain-containing protein [Nitrospirota bacterium]|nr:DUF4388 domain-containing protein [Nitrospirota bacterium]